MRLDLKEFLRRFCLHVPPPRFVRIRHYGILSNRSRKAQVELARVLIDRICPAEPEQEEKDREGRETAAEGGSAESGGIPCCPWCGSFALKDCGSLPSGPGPLPEVSYAIDSG